jgi:AraC-like DNA-binding protein
VFAAVHMQHRNPAQRSAAFREAFHCEVLGGRERNAVFIPEALVSRPLPYPQPEYSALFRDLCRQSMASLLEERSLVEAIREVILAEPGLVPTLDQVAAQFSLSPRTLRRHLRSIGVSYRGLVDETRYATARRYLSSTGLTVESIAGLLGYADARSFRTAFRRWSGTTPAACRRDGD